MTTRSLIDPEFSFDALVPQTPPARTTPSPEANDSALACDFDTWCRKLTDPIDQMESTLDRLANLIAEATSDEPCETFDLTIIVPVYNERETLPQILERLDEVMPRRTEVIVVDDGSTDGTAEWLAVNGPRPNRRVFCRRVNHGKGSAVRLAIRHSRGSVVAIQDADLEYDPARLLSVVWPILDGNADVVYGSRYLEESSDPSLVHRFGNWILTSISNMLTGLRLTDMETCHKAFDGEMLRSIALKECRFGFEPEITAKVAARNARVIEVPTGYECRGYDEGKKIGWRDAVSAFACMWKYRKG